MPDISMCAREDCPLSERCYRHEDSGTKPTPSRQSYMRFPGGVDCPDYWPPYAAAPEQPVPPKTDEARIERLAVEARR